MFEKLTGLFKKESKPKDTSQKKDVVTETNQSDVLVSDELEPVEPITQSIGSDGFIESEYTVQLNLDSDVEMDQDKMLEDLTEVFRKELEEAASVEEVERKVEEITDAIGITDTEWEEVYNNVSLIGYETRYQQLDVFRNTCPDEFNVYKESVLDVGCAIGDFHAYCQEILNCAEPKYTGIDYNENMINLAKKKYPEAEKNFITSDLLDHEGNYDWVVAMSIFDIPMQDDMNKYVRICIDKMYELADKGVCLNLSNLPDKYNSAELYKWAVNKYNNVKIHNNYIENNFYLQIFKQQEQ